MNLISLYFIACSVVVFYFSNPSVLCLFLKGFISKTLDSVSAQFAASALVTSEQLMGFKMKDDVVLGIGVNGILQASGKKCERIIFFLDFVF